MKYLFNILDGTDYEDLEFTRYVKERLDYRINRSSHPIVVFMGGDVVAVIEDRPVLIDNNLWAVVKSDLLLDPVALHSLVIGMEFTTDYAEMLKVSAEIRIKEVFDVTGLPIPDIRGAKLHKSISGIQVPMLTNV